MSRSEILCTRYGEMVDMVNCLSIYDNGAKPKTRMRKYTVQQALELR